MCFLLPLLQMKNKNVIAKLFLVAFLTSFLIQGLHSYEHCIIEPIKDNCLNKKNSLTEKLIAPEHSDTDHCKLCLLYISIFTQNSYLNFKFFGFSAVHILSFSICSKIIFFFTGSLYGLRAPPYQLLLISL
jgi:hypothetical protein